MTASRGQGDFNQLKINPCQGPLVRRRQIDQVSRGDVVVLEPPLDPAGRFMPGPPGADGRHWNIKRAVASREIQCHRASVPPGIACPRVRWWFVEQGTHHELMSMGSRYAHLFDTQASGYREGADIG
ncbi:hypothetical protein [Nonomuraea sp. NPDC049784]|uniref:hypothetical protein n=1 Tax=Nonomuraea sp. NPDC049784 TaxID=3154361 RepID=UPI0033F4D757